MKIGMTNDVSNLSGLEVVNTKRQAIPPLRGYDYQVWQSLFRWINLGEREVLFLEGAEDVDVLRDGEAETVQVKETARSGTVTLGSANVIEAIKHFWEHQKNNPGYVVRFRFLTTSPRGQEQFNPFGGMRGLDYWDQCKRSHTDLQLLRTFLKSKEVLPPDLREFIEDASDDDLRDKLIRRVEWDTGQGDRSDIEELVRKRTIAHGARLHMLAPSESVKVVSRLFGYVWEVICRDDNRRLEYADFARLFEEYSTIRITRRELQRRIGNTGAVQDIGLENSTVNFALGRATEIANESYALPHLHQMARRERLIIELRTKLSVKGILILKGSSGMGKSTLASIIAADIVGGQWRRLDLRELEPERIKEHLTHATLADASEPEPNDYIIDDLNFDKRPTLYERALSGFMHAVTLRGGSIILTTQGDLPNRIKLAFDLPQDVIFNVPTLTEEEIGQVAYNCGCPSGKKLETWSRIIQANTSGHPLLVHARVRNLAAAGWIEPKSEELFNSKDLEDVRLEVRRTLQEQLPSEQARALAYRLSVFAGYFKRPHALHLAEHPPALAVAGEAFDSLVGPWVERLEHGYHRLSPLLRDAARQMFSPEEVKNIHKTAAYAYLTENNLTPTELGGVLLHGLLGEIAEPLVAVAGAANKITSGEWASVAREIDWFAHIATQPGATLFKGDPVTSQMLRGIQFKVAAELDSAGLALRVVESWRCELNAFDEHRDHPMFLVGRTAAQMIFNMTDFRLEVPVPMRTIVWSIARGVALERECRAAAASGNKIVRQMLETGATNIADVETFVFVAAVRCKNADDVAEFFDAVEQEEPDAAEAIWSELRNNELTAMTLINAAWLNATKEVSPDWTRCVQVIERAAGAALSRKADALAAGAFRSKAILYKEYMPSGGDAMKVLAECTARLGYEHPAIQDYLAKIHLLDERYEDALRVWGSIPAEPETQDMSTRIFSHRDAVMCAGKLGDWSSAAEYALLGEKAARRLLHLGETVAVGFAAENAFALWKSGDFEDSLAAFARVVDALGTLPDPDSDIKSYILHFRVLLVIKRIGHNTFGDENLIESELGSFSDPYIIEAKREKPVPPYLFYWYYLADAEYKVKAEAKVLLRLDKEAQELNIPLVQTQIEELHLKYALRNLELASLIDEYSKFSNSAIAFAASQNNIVPNSVNSQMLVALCFAALVKLVGVDKLDESPIDKWMSDAKRHGFLDDSLEKFFSLMKRAVKADKSELLDSIKDASIPGESRLVAALILSHSDELAPQDRFIANTVLVTTGYAYAMWREETEFIVERSVADGWTDVVAKQRFALLSPAITAPDILRDCRDNTTQGLKKAARVLLSSRHAVRVNLPDQLISQLQEMAS